MVESYNSITDQKFLFAIKFVLNNEGGYSNNNNDNGGETKYGISKRMYPDLDISSLKIDEAIRIYYRDFWSTNRYYEIDDEKIAAKIFDFSINIGVKCHWPGIMTTPWPVILAHLHTNLLFAFCHPPV